MTASGPAFHRVYDDALTLTVRAAEGGGLELVGSRRAEELLRLRIDPVQRLPDGTARPLAPNDLWYLGPTEALAAFAERLRADGIEVSVERW